MNNRIHAAIEKYDMLSRGDRVLAAVSGGADSMLLLHYLISFKEKYGITVEAAHIEHGIRGQDSVDDAEFVADFCKKNNIEFHLLSIQAPAEAEKLKMSVEEYSRKRRYEFFYSIPCDKIATAHNLSDNAETVLFRLSRGTGLKGMCGIPPVRDKIIRPLLEISSDEIRAYCKENGIAYRTDSTNTKNDYSRNYIRNVIVPEFERLNSDFEGAVSAFIHDTNEDMAFIEKAVNHTYRDALVDGRLSLKVLLQNDISVVKRVITRYFSDYNIHLDRVHLYNVLELTHKIGRVQLRGDYYAVSDKKYLRFADFSDRENHFSFVSKILKISEFDNKGVDFYCDCDKIIGTVKIRSRRAGDAITPANRGCKKTLKKLFNELKIPQEMRDSVGIVTDDEGVIGVIGYCADERVKTDCGTKNIYCLLSIPSED